MVKNPPAMQEMKFWSLGWEDPVGKEMAPTPVFLLGQSHEQRSLVGYSPWGPKESDTAEERAHTQLLGFGAGHLTFLGLICHQ